MFYNAYDITHEIEAHLNAQSDVSDAKATSAEDTKGRVFVTTKSGTSYTVTVAEIIVPETWRSR